MKQTQWSVGWYEMSGEFVSVSNEPAAVTTCPFCNNDQPVVNNDRCAECNDEYMSEPVRSTRYSSEMY